MRAQDWEVIGGAQLKQPKMPPLLTENTVKRSMRATARSSRDTTASAKSGAPFGSYYRTSSSTSAPTLLHWNISRRTVAAARKPKNKHSAAASDAAVYARAKLTCTDDADEHLSKAGYSCSFLTTLFGCSYDLHKQAPKAAPVGSLLKVHLRPF
jgi:hypothetical protein